MLKVKQILYINYQLLKKCNESLFWLELIERIEYITIEQFNSIFDDAVEIMKLTTRIIITTKKNLKKGGFS